MAGAVLRSARVGATRSAVGVAWRTRVRGAAARLSGGSAGAGRVAAGAADSLRRAVASRTASAGVARRPGCSLEAPALGGSLVLGFAASPPPSAGFSPLGAGTVFTGGTVTEPTLTAGTETDGTVPTGVVIAGVCTGGVEIGGVEIGGVVTSGPPCGTGIVIAGTVTAGTSTAGGDCCATAGIPPVPIATTTTVTPKHQRRQFM
jgi:hypothetical protein